MKHTHKSFEDLLNCEACKFEFKKENINDMLPDEDT